MQNARNRKIDLNSGFDVLPMTHDLAVKVVAVVILQHMHKPSTPSGEAFFNLKASMICVSILSPMVFAQEVL